MVSNTLWMANVQFDIQKDIKQIGGKQVFVGYSGGVDSTLLLHQAVQAVGAAQVTAIHIHHGLSPLADQWQAHCAQFCVQLGCEFRTVGVDVANQGLGVEAAARQARYAAFEQIIPSNGLLLLGHHMDDQVETYFLRLFRGAGQLGLRGMSRELTRDHYRIFRPLLVISRTQIETIAAGLQLQWIEDPSNANEGFDRNFLRQQVLPLIETRWPAYRDKVIQSMQLMNPEPELQTDFDVKAELEHRLSHDNGLKLVQIDQFSDLQLMSLLHAWLQRIGLQTPSQARLKTIVDCVISARPDAQPVVEIANGCVRRHGPALYWVQQQTAIAQPPVLLLNEPQMWSGVGKVTLVESSEVITKIKLGLPDLHWRLRQGDESMRPIGRSKSRDLKRLLQEYRVKPWLRDRMPLLFSEQSLIAVGDVLISADHVASENEEGLRVIWQNSD